jgi:5-methylcytosine-specific restriction endonuclease McrA
MSDSNLKQGLMQNTATLLPLPPEPQDLSTVGVKGDRDEGPLCEDDCVRALINAADGANSNPEWDQTTGRRKFHRPLAARIKSREKSKRWRKTPAGLRKWKRDLAKKRAHDLRAKAECFEHYCGKDFQCRCGATDIRVMQLHHRDNDGFGGTAFYAALRREGFPPANLAALCANCHMLVKYEAESQSLAFAALEAQTSLADRPAETKTPQT